MPITLEDVRGAKAMSGDQKAPSLTSRYAKQFMFGGIGSAGQGRILRSHVTVVGLGALGTVIAEQLARAGVGHLRLIDRDFVELSNLQRQTLFQEQDARERLPKAVAAATRLQSINSEIEIKPVIADVTPRNVEQLLAGSDVVLDGTDNLETRFLINDVCIKLNIPWVYGGALGAMGSTMTIVPGRTACLRCLIDHAPPPGVMASCDTEGVLAAVTGVVASVECAEALKLLTGHTPQGGLLNIDVWERDFREVEVERRRDCPACVAHQFEYLNGDRIAWTTVLCGRNSVQIVPPEEHEIDLPELQRRLASVGVVSYNGFLLSLLVQDREIVLFPTGRAIIRGTTDEAEARTIYARYIGT
jgi:molybdopterin/thiamine biosynthesis adenylyltransferase